MNADLPIDKNFIDKLFDNQVFIDRLALFIQTHRSQDLSQLFEVNMISDQITELLLQQQPRNNQLQFDRISQELGKIQNQLNSIKNNIKSDKFDLEMTYYNKSRLEISSILQQDITNDFGDVKTVISEIQQKLSLWLGSNEGSQKSISKDNQPKINDLIDKKTIQHFYFLERKLEKRLEASDLMTQKRMEQLNKTLNNVLTMLNQNTRKVSKADCIQGKISEQSIKTKPRQLAHQSSLHNFKLKNLLNFAQK